MPETNDWQFVAENIGEAPPITAADGVILAALTVHARGHRTTTENLIDIGSALLWSHWRWTEITCQPPGENTGTTMTYPGGDRMGVPQ